MILNYALWDNKKKKDTQGVTRARSWLIGFEMPLIMPRLLKQSLGFANRNIFFHFFFIQIYINSLQNFY